MLILRKFFNLPRINSEGILSVFFRSIHGSIRFAK